MKRIVFSVILILAVSCMVSNFANALDKTSTGFYYPIGRSDFKTENGWWLSKDPDYYPEEYHIGVDMMTYSTNADAYAIADGIVKHVSLNGWGEGNCGLAIEHQRKDGSIFIAIYGHLKSNTVPAYNARVCAGESIGKTGNWDDGIHLHFGIHDGSYNTMPSNHWGKMEISNWPDQNGFIDPMYFIENNQPNNFLPRAVSAYFRIGDLAWYPSNVSCTKQKDGDISVLVIRVVKRLLAPTQFAMKKRLNWHLHWMVPC